ncbi:uncharacterized protein LOC106173519 [Lingula anatina]|uniref:Uncharacterized protein LOC106173519 n=1 Tax=Lingula anatina TaxID=7574 RepID=A0A2R2MN87_LINAN|nr:uncharacterized protein LOC106173519 [Lingula anatina]|eukprot:XP_023931670.1 uncharacterized protein LOC106173519 [Lingula anatina]
MDCRIVWDKYSNCWDSTPGQPSHGGQGLLGQWYDACSGWYTTIDRIQVFSFALPFLKAPMSNFFVLKGQGSSFSSRNMAGKKIGFVDGWASDEKCLNRWTDVVGQDTMQVVHGPTPTDLVAKLQNGEIAAIFATISDMEPHTGATNPVVERVPSASFSCMIAGSAMMTRKDSDFNSKWNVGFNKLVSSGKFKKLCAAGQQTHGSRGNVDCVDG